jgi:hypothetical protein
VTIPGSVTTIGFYAFSGNPALTEILCAGNPKYTCMEGILLSKDRTTLVAYPVGRGNDCTIPAGVTAVREGAFSHDQLASVTIGAGIIFIPKSGSVGSVNVVSVGSFHFFMGWYNANGKQEGTYVLQNDAWIKQ